RFGGVRAIATDQHQLRAVKNIGNVARVDVFSLNAAPVNPHVTKYRVIDLRAEVRDLDLNVFVRRDVISRARVFRRDAVEQHGVDVVTDAEGKQPRVSLVGLFDVPLD